MPPGTRHQDALVAGERSITGLINSPGSTDTLVDAPKVTTEASPALKMHSRGGESRVSAYFGASLVLLHENGELATITSTLVAMPKIAAANCSTTTTTNLVSLVM